MDGVAIAGDAINRLAASWIDPGLGGFLEQLAASQQRRSAPYVSSAVRSFDASTLSALAQANRGKHRVPTLRNVDLRPTQCRSFARSPTLPPGAAA